MEKLTATDASFLYSETRHCNSNIGSLNILELPAEQSAGAFVESLKTYMSDRLHLVSYLSRKLAFVPGNWDHPAWVEDDNVNMDNHIINFPVESPGKLADIERAVAWQSMRSRCPWTGPCGRCGCLLAWRVTGWPTITRCITQPLMAPPAMPPTPF